MTLVLAAEVVLETLRSPDGWREGLKRPFDPGESASSGDAKGEGAFGEGCSDTAFCTAALGISAASVSPCLASLSVSCTHG